MGKRYTRKVSLNEKIWISADRVFHPFVNRLMIEGNGTIDAHILRSAVEAASEANPGSRIVLGGIPGRARWIDSGATPRITEVDGSGWSGFSSEGAPFLLETFPHVSKGPLCEVMLIQGTPLRICFRTHHAIMDGRGTMHWIEDIFRAMRNEPLIGSSSTLTDMDLPISFKNNLSGPRPGGCIAPTGASDGNERGTIWIRRYIKGRFKNLLPRIAVLTADEARKHSEGKVIFNVPADRRTDHISPSTANLTVGVNIEVPPGTTPDFFADMLKKQVRDQSRNIGLLFRTLYPLIPTWLMAMGLDSATKRMRSSGRYQISGLITNLGRVPVDRYRAAGFQATSVFLLPLNFDSIPTFITMSGTENSADIILGVPRMLASRNRIETLLELISTI
ncbi:MAG: hypothetical protein CVU55_05490 [Deltaproteobacteria bacterium HGW-Deltaproteobacteria-13]|jgi:hypothetical protein|nr:MAG: hypothetical protein CVU55_05490 [Deltaproteobacteria bacterium HGW-Deltaproteobacteria-13]